MGDPELAQPLRVWKTLLQLSLATSPVAGGAATGARTASRLPRGRLEAPGGGG